MVADKKFIGVKLTTEVIGFAGSDGQSIEFRPPSSQEVKQPGASSHPGACLSELRERIRQAFAMYDVVAIQSSNYRLNVNSFARADSIARMTGVVLLAACEHRLKVVEVAPNEVSELATGKLGAVGADYLAAANSNGLTIKSEYAAEAYWIMSLAKKGK